MTGRKTATARKLCLIFQAVTLRITKPHAIARWAQTRGEPVSVTLIYKALKALR